MESLASFRRAVASNQAALNGTRPQVPVGQTIQKRARDAHAEILALPERILEPVQTMDPESENFGLFDFIYGIDGFGDAPL